MKLRMWFAVAVYALIVPAVIASSVPEDLLIFDARHMRQQTDAVMSQLADKRVVFIGEDHERYGQHLSQLEIIRRLHMQAPGHWTIGIEYFQRSFQPYLDDYIAGTISEREFLIKTEYFERWGYDYRTGDVIIQYAREEHIPIIALN